MPVILDDVDIALLRQLMQWPKAGMREYARTLELARATIQTRLDRLHELGVITDWAPQISARNLGFPVMAFTHIHLRQGSLDLVAQRLTAISHVVEAHSTTGEADMFCRIVARDHPDLESVIQQIIAIEGVVRTRTDIALSERLAPRVLPLIELASDNAPTSTRARHQRSRST